MPSVPFFQSHCVVVDFLVKIVKKGNSLDDHDIHLLSRELELISRETVSHTQGHSLKVFGIEFKEISQIESDHSHEFVDAVVLFTLNSEGFGDEFAELLVSHSDFVFDLLFNNVLVEELGQGLRDLAIKQLGNALESIRSALELVESFQGHTMSMERLHFSEGSTVIHELL